MLTLEALAFWFFILIALAGCACHASHQHNKLSSLDILCFGGWSTHEGHQKIDAKDRLLVATANGVQGMWNAMIDLGNWRAGLTVGLVAVPLSISLGIASGTTPMRGIASGVVGGIACGLFGSSSYNIVGPAGALSGMLMACSTKWTDEVFPWMCLISAGFIMLAMFFKLHHYAAYVPSAVLEGFTLAVAIIIGLGQINFACGVSPGKKHEHVLNNTYESLVALSGLRMSSVVTFCAQVSVLLLLMKKYARVPWTVIVSLISMLLGWLSNTSSTGIELLTLGSKYGSLVPRLIQPLHPLQSLVSSGDILALVLESACIAFVAVSETLISAKLAANRTGHLFDETSEIRGLAIAHLACGIVGAMPPTGVFIRTAMNTSLGATHRFAQLLQAMVLGVIAFAFLPCFLLLPQATVAAILVVASIKMVPFRQLRGLLHDGKGNVWLCLATASACVICNPVVGLLVGTFVHLVINKSFLWHYWHDRQAGILGILV